MDIIFQSGEFCYEVSFWTTFGGPIASLLGILISGLVAVYIFSKGVKKDRELANEQRMITTIIVC